MDVSAALNTVIVAKANAFFEESVTFPLILPCCAVETNPSIAVRKVAANSFLIIFQKVMNPNIKWGRVLYEFVRIFFMEGGFIMQAVWPTLFFNLYPYGQILDAAIGGLTEN